MKAPAIIALIILAVFLGFIIYGLIPTYRMQQRKDRMERMENYLNVPPAPDWYHPKKT